MVWLQPRRAARGEEDEDKHSILKEKLLPELPDYNKFKENDQKFKQLQKCNYDRHHAVHPLPPIPDDSKVWVTTDNRQTSGQVVSRANTPRSYVVQTDSGTVRRNRRHLTAMPKTPVTERTSSERSTIMTRSRTGALMRPPSKI